jgi:hypothetical protein
LFDGEVWKDLDLAGDCDLEGVDGAGAALATACVWVAGVLVAIQFNDVRLKSLCL